MASSMGTATVFEQGATITAHESGPVAYIKGPGQVYLMASPEVEDALGFRWREAELRHTGGAITKGSYGPFETVRSGPRRTGLLLGFVATRDLNMLSKVTEIGSNDLYVAKRVPASGDVIRVVKGVGYEGDTAVFHDSWPDGLGYTWHMAIRNGQRGYYGPWRDGEYLSDKPFSGFHLRYTAAREYAEAITKAKGDLQDAALRPEPESNRERLMGEMFHTVEDDGLDEDLDTPPADDDDYDEPRKIDLGNGKDAKTVVNGSGGKQSALAARFDLLPAEALFSIGIVLADGAEKYGENNWHAIEVESHLNHAINHAYAWLAGDQDDAHLSHFATRALFALWKEIQAKRTLEV